MTVTLDVKPRGEVAVLHGIDTEAAIAHLCRAVVTGSVFDVYRALVVDLEGLTDLGDDAAAELALAAAARQERRQWLGAAESTAGIDAEVARAQQWLQLVDDERPNPLVTVAAATLRIGTAPLRWALRRIGR